MILVGNVLQYLKLKGLLEKQKLYINNSSTSTNGHFGACLFVDLEA